jgi:predicted O-methyltransferase YrrM
MTKDEYEFTNDWFLKSGKSVWESLIRQINPTKILEIGVYEGACTCYLIEKIGNHKPVEIHCVDTWTGSIEHQEGGIAESDMKNVERRFYHNTALAKKNVSYAVHMHIHKQASGVSLANMFSKNKASYFDFVYIDGSHQAPDVLLDALLAFQLLRVGGVIAFDDYLWQENLPHGTDPIRCPKIAIDAFSTIFCRKLKILSAPLYQLYIQKVSN